MAGRATCDLGSLLPLLLSSCGLLGQAVYVFSRGANHHSTPTFLVSHTCGHKKSTGAVWGISPTSRSQTRVLRNCVISILAMGAQSDAAQKLSVILSTRGKRHSKGTVLVRSREKLGKRRASGELGFCAVLGPGVCAGAPYALRHLARE